MTGDLPSKKSELNLKPFGVGVLVVGIKAMPWIWYLVEVSVISLSQSSVWPYNDSIEMHGGSITQRGKEVYLLEAWNGTQPKKNTQDEKQNSP